MFGKHVIRLGDPTTHGGTVVSASSTYEMFGKQVACLGDKVTCPVPGHGVCTIVEGDPIWTIDGRHVALEGHKTSCGASLISTLPNVTRSYEGMGVAGAGGAAASAISGASAMAASVLASDKHDYDMHWLVLDKDTGEPAANLPYKITLDDGRSIEGMTDSQGLTDKIGDAYASVATIEVPYYGNSSSNPDSDEQHDTCHC